MPAESHSDSRVDLFAVGFAPRAKWEGSWARGADFSADDGPRLKVTGAKEAEEEDFVEELPQSATCKENIRY